MVVDDRSIAWEENCLNHPSPEVVKNIKRLQKLEKENQDLHARLERLEEQVASLKEGLSEHGEKIWGIQESRREERKKSVVDNCGSPNCPL